jgi:hypothetical protein
VLDPAGEPLRGASVLLCATGPRYDASRALETGPDGAFEIPFESEKEARAMRTAGVVHPRFLAEYARLPRGPQAFVEGTLRLDVKLRPAHRLSFHVTDEAGLPVDGAWIAVADANANRGRALPADPDAEPGPAWGALFSGGRRLDAKTDDAGLAAFENAPGGELAVTLSKPGWVPTTLLRLRADRAPFERRHVVLTRGLRIAGTVRDAAGSAVADAEVRILAAGVVVAGTTAADGSFALGGIPLEATRAELAVTHPEHAVWYRGGIRSPGVIPLDGTPLEVVLAPGRTLELFLVDDATGRPFDGPVRVVLHPAPGILHQDTRRVEITGGNLRLEHLPDGVRELWIDAHEQESLAIPLDVHAGEPIRLVPRGR